MNTTQNARRAAGKILERIAREQGAKRIVASITVNDVAALIDQHANIPFLQGTIDGLRFELERARQEIARLKKAANRESKKCLPIPAST